MKKSLIILAVLGICLLSTDLATQAYDNNTKGTISINTSAAVLGLGYIIGL